MAKQEAAVKVRKKKWFTILAPAIFKQMPIGEIPLYESESMKGRGMTVNMMNLTGNPKNQNINVSVRVVDVKDGKGITELLGFQSNPGSLKRLVRRGKSKIEDSFVVMTSDGKKIRIKPLLISGSVIPHSVNAAVKKSVRNNLATLAQKLTYEKFIEEIISFKIQKHIGTVASKITPIRNSEIRAFVLIEKEGVKVYQPTAELEVVEEEEYTDEETPEPQPAPEQAAQE